MVGGLFLLRSNVSESLIFARLTSHPGVASKQSNRPINHLHGERHTPASPPRLRNVGYGRAVTFAHVELTVCGNCIHAIAMSDEAIFLGRAL